LDVRLVLASWGYLALFLGVLLGNVGLPLPESCLLWVAGALVWQGRFSLPIVLAAGVAAAVVGDNGGYWIGRRYGHRLLARHGRRLGLTERRIAAVRSLLVRHGPLGVFGARFVTGLRFLAGPVAGLMGLAPRRFLLANVLGALVYVPLTVGEGYAAGYGLGAFVHRLHRGVASLELAAVCAVLLGVALVLGWRILRGRHVKMAAERT
jgi:membrane protein DedA with SNARE-associated domain